MKGLIAALQFLLQFMKNPEDKYPTTCDYDVLYVCGIDFSKMSYEQVKTLINVYDFYPGSGDNWNYICKVAGENFDWDYITEEQWKFILENNCLNDCVYSYKYGSC